jgi:hypothetical protein
MLDPQEKNDANFAHRIKKKRESGREGGGEEGELL